MKRKAIYTLVHNESFFLPLWLKYYHRYFHYDDIYILDHESTDGSTDDMPCRRISITHDYVHDDIFMNETITKFQYTLLRDYEYTLYADADEFIYHEDGLDHYIENLKSPCVTCNGYEVVHCKEKEAPFDISLSILEQRSYWIRSKMYSKPVLSSIPMFWDTGRHMAENQGPLDKDLLLLHLKRVDYNIALNKNRKTSASTISPHNIRSGWGCQCWITNKEFDNWFDKDFYQNYHDANIELIPDPIKKGMPL